MFVWRSDRSVGGIAHRAWGRRMLCTLSLIPNPYVPNPICSILPNLWNPVQACQTNGFKTCQTHGFKPFKPFQTLSNPRFQTFQTFSNLPKSMIFKPFKPFSNPFQTLSDLSNPFQTFFKSTLLFGVSCRGVDRLRW